MHQSRKLQIPNDKQNANKAVHHNSIHLAYALEPLFDFMRSVITVSKLEPLNNDFRGHTGSIMPHQPLRCGSSKPLNYLTLSTMLLSKVSMHAKLPPHINLYIPWPFLFHMYAAIKEDVCVWY